jgi:hypothetical protein
VSQGWGHLTIDGVAFGNSSATPVMQEAIFLQWCNGATITNCWFEGTYAVADIVLGNIGYGGSGINIVGNVICNSNSAQTSGVYSIQILDVHDWTISGNRIGGIGTVANNVYINNQGSGGNLGVNQIMPNSIVQVQDASVLTENTIIDQNGNQIGFMPLALPTMDLQAVGTAQTVTVSTNVNAGQLLYLSSAGTYLNASATSAATMNVIGMATQTVSSGNTCVILTHGYFMNTAWSWSPIGSGVYLYCSTTGQLTATAPSSAGNVVQWCATPITSNIVLFNI